MAEKRIPLVVESFLKPYDYIPLVNIVEESGGIISDWRGNPLNFQSNGDVVASISKKQAEEIAKKKMKDLNANDLEQATKIIMGSARSMGIEVKE